MPAVKTTAKKAVKPAAKAARKITMDDINANFDRIQKTLDEIAEIHKETEKAQRKTEKNLDELREIHKETEKAHREFVEAHKEAHKEAEKVHKETEKNLNKMLGGLSNTLGSLVERFMTTGLPKKFKRLGFTFDRVTIVRWAEGETNIYAEIDGLLENGTQAMVVEVKTTLRNEDIDDHLVRMEKVRKYADLHGDGREFLGALAAVVVAQSSRAYALKKGFFVIEPSGEDVKITKPVSEKIW
jgi:hypothetical protein